MIGQAFFGLWIAGLTAGAIVLGQQFSPGAPATTADGEPMPVYRHLQTEMLAVPWVQNRQVGGYFITRFTVKVNVTEEEKGAVPVDLLVYDAVNRHLAQGAEILDRPYGWRELTSSMMDLPAEMNKRAGHDVVTELLVEQLDYFEKEEVRMPPEFVGEKEEEAEE